MKVPYSDTTDLSMQSEKSGLEDVIHLTGQPQVVQRQPAPIKTDPDHPMINMSEFQKQLLSEINKRPEIMKLFKVIFQEYPIMVTKEFRLSSVHATHRQKIQRHNVSMERNKLEAWVEQEICKLSGIDINAIASDNIEKSEVTEEEVSIAIKNEVKVTEEKAWSEVVEKITKKTTKKKASRKKS